MSHWNSTAPGQVRVTDRDLRYRAGLNRDYLMSLKEEELLRNFTFEAGLANAPWLNEQEMHGGWESPTCQLRGHFLGHYLSACAHGWANDGDAALRGRGESIVYCLAKCQREHGNGWVFSIPDTYLNWIARGKHVWAPHYTVHKTLMGLIDMAALCGCGEAKQVAVNAAEWFYDWTGRFTREQFNDILDTETGGMMEAWADLYALTGDEKHLELMRRYERPRLYKILLEGGDPLSNMHANTTIPEMHGVMRAWEVTGEQRYLDIVKAYWKCAVTDRGFFATGGQTCDELWTPKGEFREYLGPDNQEHCTVYNLCRLADFLFRETGEIAYADYIERNYINGILAQQHTESGMVAYYLPMHAGSRIHWGTRTKDFWCCHGTLVQAQTRHGEQFCYTRPDALCIAQYFGFELTHAETGAQVSLRRAKGSHYALIQEPPARGSRNEVWQLHVTPGEKPMRLQLRMPWWLPGKAQLLKEDGTVLAEGDRDTWMTVEEAGGEYTLVFPVSLWCCPLPDDPETVALMEGPDVLIGITDRNTLHYDGPASEAWKILRRVSRSPYDRSEDFFEATGQEEGIRFIPLRRLEDEKYTLYFKVIG